MSSIPSQLPFMNPDRYAAPTPTNGNGRLRMYQVTEGRKNPWLFAHRENARAAVHALTIVENKEGEQFVYLLVTRRPPLGGRLSLECPAGLWGDQDKEESALTAANREVREETGHTVKSQLLATNLFATSAGMTTEHKVFALSMAKGEPQEPQFDGDEATIIVDKKYVPLSTFANYDKFQTWLSEMEQQNYTVGLDVLAARGLMPPVVGNRINVSV